MGRKYSWSTRLVLIGGIVSLCFFWLMVNGSAKTITVDDDGGAEYETIQDAINASVDGDTIRVWEGTYEKSVVVNKSVSLVGNGSEQTTISFYKGDVVTIEADWVSLSGFRVMGDDGLGYSGIRVESDHNVIFGNNCSINYFGIKLQDSNNNTIESNTCSNNSFGIIISNSDNNTIMNNTCYNNDIGIYLPSSSNSTIKNNICNYNKEGINIPDSSNCTIINNTCDSNNLYGICLHRSIECTITNNTSSKNDIGINLHHSDECIIMNNTCSNNNNHGIYLEFSNDCIIENNNGTIEVKNDDEVGGGGFTPEYWMVALAVTIGIFIISLAIRSDH